MNKVQKLLSSAKGFLDGQGEFKALSAAISASTASEATADKALVILNTALNDQWELQSRGLMAIDFAFDRAIEIAGND